MKPASITTIKKTLKDLSKEELTALILKLGTLKVDNKAMLSYLLYYENDKTAYLAEVQQYILTNFDELNQDSTFYVRKGLRKIEREINKQIKYVKDKVFEIELLILFLKSFKTLDKIHQQKLNHIFERIMLKTKSKINALHEDLQYDFNSVLNTLD